MHLSPSRLLLLLPLFLCLSCDDAGEFSLTHSPALSRTDVAAGQVGSFAGERVQLPCPEPEPASKMLPEPVPAPEPAPAPEPPPAVSAPEAKVQPVAEPAPQPPSEPAPNPKTRAASEPPVASEPSPQSRSLSLGDGESAMGAATQTSSALVGTFYDLKLTRNGRRTALYSPSGQLFDKIDLLGKCYAEVVRDPASLERFYKSPTQLFASHFYLPTCEARYGPLAYRCDTNLVKPCGWVVVYRGKVRAPKSGKFRFVGTGDDFIHVRFNNKTVLEAGFAIPSLYDARRPGFCTRLSAFYPEGKQYIAVIRAGKERGHQGYEYTRLPAGWGWNMVGGLTHGSTFEVREGEVYPIEIMISEGPGGSFGFVLLMEDMLDNPQGGKPELERVFNLFRTDSTLPDAAEIKKHLQQEGCLSAGQFQNPRFNKNSPIWQVVP